MKIFERIVRDEIMLKSYHLINEKQHGFLPRKSCDTQMLYFHENVTLSMNNNNQADVVYFDF